jgi:23S rRNA (uridine2552-2'-O)-methyltransferase
VTKSSKEWLRRHVTDPYVRQAKAQGYRSRAAFKLLEIDKKEKLLRPGMRVLDLGAAPGGWSQVAAEKRAKVIAIDLLPMEPIPGVTVLQGDFQAQAFDGSFDVILSDVSPNMSGIRNVDQARALALSLAAVDLCAKVLKPEGAFLVKAFHGESFDDLLLALKKAFREVKVIKPSASRDESRENYLLARRLNPAA